MNRFRRRVISAMFVILGGSTATAASDEWIARTHIDPMTDERTAYARSAPTPPVTPMRHPYADNWGVVALSCDEALSLVFRYKPLLRGVQRRGVRDVVLLPVRFDDAPPFDLTLVRAAGSNVMYVPPGESKALRLAALVFQESEMLIGLPWYNCGTVYFRFDLRGSREAFREACGR